MSDSKPKTEPSMEEILATVRRIIAEEESGAVSVATGPPIVSSDILDLTEAVGLDGNVRHLAAFAGSPRNLGDTRASPPQDGRIEPEAPRPPAPAEAAQQEPQRLAETVATPGPRAADIASGTQMAGSVPAPLDTQAKAEPRLGAGDRTLEDIVRDVLRPMLRAWLDENLPSLVEREVQAEIARVAREAVAGEQETATRRRGRRSTTS